MAKAKLDNATAADLERLRAEFEIYKDGSCKERRGAEVWTAFGTAFPKRHFTKALKINNLIKVWSHPRCATYHQTTAVYR